MDFYLVRHGEAVSKTVDPQRPLTRAGRQDVERLAHRALSRGIRPSTIFHSGILRARQTAEVLAQILSPAVDVRAITGFLPEDDPMIARSELEAAEQPFMVVGHLPHLSRLVALLVRGDAESESLELTPATMVCCSFAGGAWTIGSILRPDSG